MMIRNSTSRVEGDHQTLKASEPYGPTVELTFNHGQEQLIMLGLLHTVQKYPYCSSIT